MLSSIGAFLLLGGCVVTLVGLVWHKTANLLRAFGVNVKSEAGFWVLLAGLVAMGAGYGLFRLDAE
jgi:hypothetical protein